MFKDKVIFRIHSKKNNGLNGLFIELRRNNIKEYDSIFDWWKHKYTAKCGDMAVTDSMMLFAICKLALMLLEERVRYCKELEDRGFRK